MSRFKKIDVIIQICLIITVILINVIRQSDMLSEFFLFSYIIVGGWQLISAIIHFFFTADIKHRLRNVYLFLLGITLLIGLLAGITYEDNLLGFLFIMLLWTPILALLYLTTCIIENNKMKAILS